MLPVILLQGRSLRREIILQSTNLGAAVASIRADLAKMRTVPRRLGSGAHRLQTPTWPPP